MPFKYPLIDCFSCTDTHTHTHTNKQIQPNAHPDTYIHTIIPCAGVSGQRLICIMWPKQFVFGADKVRPLADIPASVHVTRTVISPVILPAIMSAELLIVDRRSVREHGLQQWVRPVRFKV